MTEKEVEQLPMLLTVNQMRKVLNIGDLDRK